MPILHRCPLDVSARDVFGARCRSDRRHNHTTPGRGTRARPSGELARVWRLQAHKPHAMTWCARSCYASAPVTVMAIERLASATPTSPRTACVDGSRSRGVALHAAEHARGTVRATALPCRRTRTGARARLIPALDLPRRVCQGGPKQAVAWNCSTSRPPFATPSAGASKTKHTAFSGVLFTLRSLSQSYSRSRSLWRFDTNSPAPTFTETRSYLVQIAFFQRQRVSATYF